MSVYLGIDIGTSGTKTLAIDDKGAILASAMETYPCYFPKPLWSEQDPDDWWAAIRTATAVSGSLWTPGPANDSTARATPARSMASIRWSPKSDSRAVMRCNAPAETPPTVGAQYFSKPGQRKCSSSAILRTNGDLLIWPAQHLRSMDDGQRGPANDLAS